MNQIGHQIYRIVKLALLALALPFLAFGQELQDKSALEREVEGILGKYAYLVSAIKPDIQPDPVRPFVQLFRNVRVEIYNDLEPSPEQEMISVVDYAQKLKTFYPDGLVCEMDYSSMKIGKLPENTDARKVVEVKVKRTVSFADGDGHIRKTEKVIFQIGYDYEDGRYKNILIRGITPASSFKHELIVDFAPSLSKVANSNLASDSRFNLPWKFSWNTGLKYQLMINDSWGVGTGLSLARKNHRLYLDKIDAFRSHNPNLIDVEWKGELTYIELPLYGVYHLPLGNKMLVEFTGGVYSAYRTYESITTKAKNAHSQESLCGVISDPFDYENISNVDMGMSLGAGIRYNLNNKWSVLARAGYKQGLMSLEKETELDSPYGIYEGQFNPMFHNSGSASRHREMYLSFGIVYKINGIKFLK